MMMAADLPIEFDSLLARCMGDKDFTREMLGLFRQQMTQHVATLDATLAAKDVEGARKILHAMKGSAANLSAVSLSKLCAAMEQQAKSGTLPEAPGFSEMKRELDRVYAYYPTVEARL